MHKRREEITKFFELAKATWRAEDWGEMHVSYEIYEEEMDDRPFLQGLPTISVTAPIGATCSKGGFV